MVSRRLGAVVATVALCAAGCAAPHPGSMRTTQPSAVAPAPAGTVTLRTLGFTYGPDELRLPPSLQVQRKVDQANVVSVFFRQPAGPEAATWFRAELPRAGYRLEADQGGSLVFSGDRWAGSFTTGPDGLSGLTLRARA